MNHLISLKEQNKEDILNILSLAQKLKLNKQAGKSAPVLAGKTMIMFFPYQLSADKINSLAPDAKIMHCMPCHVGYEITRDAIDHPNSL